MGGDDGVVTFLEVATSQRIWRERISGNHAASPIYGDERIGHWRLASLALDWKALFLRTNTPLYRIETTRAR